MRVPELLSLLKNVVRLRTFHLGIAIFAGMVLLAVGFSLFTREGPRPQPQVAQRLAPPAVSTPASSLPRPASVSPSVQSVPAASSAALHTAPIIAIVLDDMGPNRLGSEHALALPAAVTFSFLPYAPDVAALVKKARAKGHEALVHVPMEPLGKADPGPHALRVSDTPAQIRENLLWDLSQFDGYVGINNHMGSRFTEDEAGLRIVMAELKTRGLLFLDSRTTAQTKAEAMAREAGLPTLRRDVFLDNDEEGSKVATELSKVERVAREHGYAIAIGHPHPQTLDQLEKWIPEAQARGFIFVPLTAILKRQDAG